MQKNTKATDPEHGNQKVMMSIHLSQSPVTGRPCYTCVEEIMDIRFWKDFSIHVKVKC